VAETRVEAWDRLERENAELRKALEPFARVAMDQLCRASVVYKTAADPERQSFQTPSMHRAFNRAAELLRAARGVGVPASIPEPTPEMVSAAYELLPEAAREHVTSDDLRVICRAVLIRLAHGVVGLDGAQQEKTDGR
jgi:hypothetical protein